MKKRFENIIINYDVEAINFIDQVFDELISKVNDIRSFFNIYPKEDVISIKIVPTKKELDNNYWCYENAPDDWVVGFTVCGNNSYKVFLVSFNDYKNTSHFKESLEDYKKVLIHEFIHVVHSILCNGNYPANFIWEGVACYLSGQWVDRNTNLPSKDDALNGTCDDNQYALLFDMILKTYNKDFVIKILKNEINGEDILNNIYSGSFFKN